MLSKFIGNVGFKKIPHTGFMYEVSCEGVIRESYSGKIVSLEVSSEGEKKIPAGATNEWIDGLSLAVVLGVTYRNSLLPIKKLKELDVIYKDGNKSNHRLTNFIWKCPMGKLNHPLLEGYCYVPGYSRYLINKQGEVISAVSANKISPYVNKDGYLMYGVQPDVGKRTIVGMHRLLCLAYLPYPGRVDSMDVNHIDGVKDNNELINLEWASRRRNSLHAHELGLSNSKPVLVKDVFDNTVKRFYSIEEAARCLEIDGETLRQRLLRPNSNVYDGSLIFKFEEDEVPWPDVKDYKYITTSNKVEIQSIKSESKIVKNSVVEVAEFFNVSPGTIYYHLSKNKHGVIFRDHLLKYISPHS